MECEFCEKQLKTISSLNYHKKTNKKCLKIQDSKNNSLKSCEFCHKYFANSNLKIHEKSCKIKKKKDDEEKDDIIENQKKEILFLKNEIFRLETENNIYIKDHEFVKTIASQPKNITTTNNNILNNTNTNFNFNDPEKVKLMIDSKLTQNHIVNGQKGVAQFACDTILKDDDGNINYFCTDTSRGMFRFQNAKGEFEKDVKAKKLTSMLIDAGIKNKSIDIATNLWMNDDGSINPERFRIFNPNANEIIMMENDNSIFRNELACLTSV